MRSASFLPLTLALCWPAGVFAKEPDSDAGPRNWDLSVGALASVAPEYAGAGASRFRLEPGLALRYGRLSLATRGAFSVRRGEDGPRTGGLRLELGGGQRWRASLGLRLDGGRSESASARLRGLGEIRNTVLWRAQASYRWDSQWRSGLAWHGDLLGRGSGHVLGLSTQRESRFSEHSTWALGATLNWADAQHMQTWYGVTATQSTKGQQPIYRPGASLRDAALTVSARTRFGPQWVLLYGASAFTLLGGAADSPLTEQREGVSAHLGLVYAF